MRINDRARRQIPKEPVCGDGVNQSIYKRLNELCESSDGGGKKGKL